MAKYTLKQGDLVTVNPKSEYGCGHFKVDLVYKVVNDPYLEGYITLDRCDAETCSSFIAREPCHGWYPERFLKFDPPISQIELNDAVSLPSHCDLEKFFGI